MSATTAFTTSSPVSAPPVSVRTEESRTVRPGSKIADGSRSRRPAKPPAAERPSESRQVGAPFGTWREGLAETALAALLADAARRAEKALGAALPVRPASEVSPTSPSPHAPSSGQRGTRATVTALSTLLPCSHVPESVTDADGGYSPHSSRVAVNVPEALPEPAPPQVSGAVTVSDSVVPPSQQPYSKTVLSGAPTAHPHAAAGDDAGAADSAQQARTFFITAFIAVFACALS